MSTIQAVRARQILNGLGHPSIEVIIWLDDGRSVISSVPTQPFYNPDHAHKITDKDNNQFMGLGVQKAINAINQQIAPQLEGQSPIKQTGLDQILVDLDGTQNKTKLGANTILAVSKAAFKAGALSVNLPLYSYLQQKYELTDYLSIPSCIFDIIHGGELGNDNLDIREFEIIPASHMDFPQALNVAALIRQRIKETIASKGGKYCESMTGGLLPKLNANADVFELILEAVKTTNFTFAQDLFFGINAGADDFAHDSKYRLKDKADRYSYKELIEFYKNIREMYKTIYIEDPFSSSDHKAWKHFTEEVGQTTHIAGDMLFKGSLSEIKKGIKDKMANTLIIKPLDIGTISETMQLIKIAKDAEWQVVISKEPGETVDDFIADLAVGIGADYVKFGAPLRGENTNKYNRFIHIHQEIQQLA
jgi:enolase